LSKISELIGLTFFQFTRSVLLAQGDFATFLKATQKEKAELLEKLTGTDIYSRISAKIYEKSKQAEQELNTLNERIKDIALLSDEELETLNQEKQSVKKEIGLITVETEQLSNKIKWLSEKELLERGVKEARQAFDESERKIEEAQIRYAYLKKVDSVQEIRDSFMELKGAQNQLTEKATNRANREEDLKTNEILLKEVSEQVISIENELIGHKEKKAALEPEIRRARELDIRISEAKNNLATAEEEYKVTDKAKNEAVKSVEETHRQIKVTQQATESINQWFGDHDHYQAIIPRTELIINLLKDAATSDDKAASNSKLLKASIEIVEHEKQTLETQKKEAERLNNLLPSEIATLRATLVEGEPCPVCGSLHHPASNVVGDSLEEAKLKKAKADIQRSIDDITKKIDSHNAENIGLKSIIDGYSKSYGESMEKLNGYLTGLPHWQEQFKNGALAPTLQKVAQQWNKYTNELKEAEKQAGMLSTQLTHEQNRAGERIKTLTAKKQTFETATRKNEDLNTERAGLLGGKKADEIEQKLSARQQDLENKFNTLTGRKSEINTTQETYKGIIEQISGEISQLQEKTGSLQHQVAEWLAQQKETMTR
ncbi:MAG: hypothetical protein Q8908_16470, partial [Bacteroidota bacterium]|nr:hypothetical protein [Bacteroidota bacterium]